MLFGIGGGIQVRNTTRDLLKAFTDVEKEMCYAALQVSPCKRRQGNHSTDNLRKLSRSNIEFSQSVRVQLSCLQDPQLFFLDCSDMSQDALNSSADASP